MQINNIIDTQYLLYNTKSTKVLFNTDNMPEFSFLVDYSGNRVMDYKDIEISEGNFINFIWTGEYMFYKYFHVHIIYK